MKKRSGENLVELLILTCLHLNSINFINNNINKFNITTNIMDRVLDMIFYYYL